MSTLGDSVTRSPDSGRYEGGWTYASDDDLFSKPNMDRFDKSFHGVDRETSRPFSHGHPDGVWVLSTIYGLGVVISAVVVGVRLSQAPHGQIGLELFLPFFVAVVLLVPPIILLFQRRKLAVIWVGVLALLSLAVALTSLVATQKAQGVDLAAIVKFAAAVLLPAYPAYYVYRLKKDGLLS